MNNQSNLLSKNDGKSEKGTTDDDDDDAGRKRAARQNPGTEMENDRHSHKTGKTDGAIDVVCEHEQAPLIYRTE